MRVSPARRSETKRARRRAFASRSGRVPSVSDGDAQGVLGGLFEQGVAFVDEGEEALGLGREGEAGLGGPRRDAGGAFEDEHAVAADGVGDLGRRAVEGGDEAVEPAVAGGGGQERGRAGLEDVLTVEMAALVAVGRRDGVGGAEFARVPERAEGFEGGVQRPEAVEGRAGAGKRRAQGGKGGIARGLDRVEAVHRAAQQDHDQAVVARGGGKADRGEERRGGERAAQSGEQRAACKRLHGRP